MLLLMDFNGSSFNGFSMFFPRIIGGLKPNPQKDLLSSSVNGDISSFPKEVPLNN